MEENIFIVCVLSVMCLYKCAGNVVHSSGNCVQTVTVTVNQGMAARLKRFGVVSEQARKAARVERFAVQLHDCF